jgi:HK97 family phage major capsid protein
MHKKTIKTLQEQRSSFVDELSAMVDISEKENRNLTEKEQATFDETSVKIEDLDARIKRLERTHEIKHNLSTETPVIHGVQDVAKTDKDLKKYRIADACRSAMNNSVEGIVKEMHQEAVLEGEGRIFRGVGVPAIALEKRVAFEGASSGQANSVEATGFIDQIVANSVLAQAGAQVYSGISASKKLPILSGITAEYLAENGGSGAGTSGDVTAKNLVPNKLVSMVTYTQEMFVQNASVDSALERNMASVISATMEANLLRRTNASAGPDSILADITTNLTSGTTNLNLASFHALETPVLGNAVSSDRLAYIFNPKGLTQLKTLANVDFSNQFLDNSQKTINGYPFYVTSNMGNAGTGGDDACVMFGAMNDIHLAFFGGLDLINDRFSQAEKGLSRLIVISLNDGLVARPNDLFSQFLDTNG